MKKIFILLFSLGSLTSVFAQSGRDRSNNDVAMNRGGYGQSNGGYSQPNNDRRDNGYKDARNTAPYSNGNDNRGGGYDNRNGRDNRNADWQRQQEIDRVNRDYNSRIDNYRRDRSINTYERNRRIGQLERERDSKIKSFAGGLLLGGVLGVLLSH
jgi:hypothetical protein